MVQKLLDRTPTTCTTQRCHIRYSSYFFRCSSRINTWTPSLLDLRLTVKLLNVNTRRCLYLALVRSHLAYASQVWSPQNTTMCMELERIQRRAMKFILALPFRMDESYKSRLVTLTCYYPSATGMSTWTSSFYLNAHMV